MEKAPHLLLLTTLFVTFSFLTLLATGCAGGCASGCAGSRNPGPALPSTGPCQYDFEEGPSGWVVETHESTRGARSVDDSELKHYRGKSSLKVRLELSKEPDSRSGGEIHVDLKTQGPGDVFGPLDLAGKVVTARIWFPPAFEGEAHSPNGIQIFAKSVKRESGQEVWGSLYSEWHDAKGHSDSWMRVRLPVTQETEGVDGPFDPGNVRLIGLKFGLGGQASPSLTFSGEIYVDCVGW